MILVFFIFFMLKARWSSNQIQLNYLEPLGVAACQLFQAHDLLEK